VNLSVVPEDLDSLLADAVDAFWRTRKAQLLRQTDAGQADVGSRGEVTGGGQMAAKWRPWRT
jgi:hypothetical protein